MCCRWSRTTLAGDTDAVVQQPGVRASAACRAPRWSSSSSNASVWPPTDRQIDSMRHELAQMDAEAQLQHQRLALAQQAEKRLEVAARSELHLRPRRSRPRPKRSSGLQARKIQAIAAPARRPPARDRATAGTPARDSAAGEGAQRGEIDRSMAELSRSRRPKTRRAGASSCVRRRTAWSPACSHRPGQAVTPATALASLAALQRAGCRHTCTRRRAQSASCAPDQPVLLRYQAFPHQKFGLQSGPGGAGLTLAAAGFRAGCAGAGAWGQRAAGEALYRITVALDRQSVAAYGQAAGPRTGHATRGRRAARPAPTDRVDLRAGAGPRRPGLTMSLSSLQSLRTRLGRLAPADAAADRGGRVRPGLPGDGRVVPRPASATCPSLRQRFSLSLKGVTMVDLVRMAGQLQLNARALRAEMEHLEQLELPCVLHWDLNHFVVLKRGAPQPRRSSTIRPGACATCRSRRCRATSPASCWSCRRKPTSGRATERQSGQPAPDAWPRHRAEAFARADLRARAGARGLRAAGAVLHAVGRRRRARQCRPRPAGHASASASVCSC